MEKSRVVKRIEKKYKKGLKDVLMSMRSEPEKPSLREMARRLGVNKSFVDRWRKRLGLTGDGSAQKYKAGLIEAEDGLPLKKIISLLRNGSEPMNVVDIAEALDVSPRTVCDWRKKHGLIDGKHVITRSTRKYKARERAKALGYDCPKKYVREATLSGKTHAQIAKALGITESSLGKYWVPKDLKGIARKRTEAQRKASSENFKKLHRWRVETGWYKYNRNKINPMGRR